MLIGARASTTSFTLRCCIVTSEVEDVTCGVGEGCPGAWGGVGEVEVGDGRVGIAPGPRRSVTSLWTSSLSLARGSGDRDDDLPPLVSSCAFGEG